MVPDPKVHLGLNAESFNTHEKGDDIGAPNKKHVSLNADNGMASFSLITHMNTGISNKNHLEFNSETANFCHP